MTSPNALDDCSHTTPVAGRTKAAAAVRGSSAKRVYFSPQTQEFTTGMTPQSSPTRARSRPTPRSILKRNARSLDTMPPQLSSDNMQQSSVQSAWPLLSPSRQDEAARVLFENGNKESEEDMPFEQLFPRDVDRLSATMVKEDSQAVAVACGLYNELAGLAAKHTPQLSQLKTKTVELLDCLHRDLSADHLPKQLIVPILKCLGCLLYTEPICVLLPTQRLADTLTTVCVQAERHLGDKAICRTASWCFGIMRPPPLILQPLLPRIVRICSRIMAQHETSTSIAYECLTAIDALVRRLPGDMRKLASFWCFPVLRALVSPAPRVRSKADSIIRLNIPWLAADAHKAELNSEAKAFLDSQLSQMIKQLTRMTQQHEHVYAARVWGMVVTVCAKHIRPRINEMLRVIQECFNSADPQVLVAALMQWRCLVYAFQWEGRVGFKKCVQLIMTPIVSILSNKESTVEVRLACVRCWATLVYALGDGVATHTEILIKPITKAVVADGSIEVMEVVARVLTALLNQFVLSPDKIPKFVVSPMIIGTTTLAAGDGKSLAETHGPFSSVDEFTKGDNTQVLGQYVVGVPVESASGVVPIVIEYIGGYIAALCSGKSTMPTGGLPSFVCLCDAACTSLNALDKDTNEDISSYLASIWSVFVTTAPICPGQDPCGCPLVESENPKSPHEVLFYAITNSVGTRLAQTVSLGPDVVDRVFPPADDSETKETTAVPEFTSALAALLPATEAEPTIPPRPIPVAHLTNAMTLTLWLNDAIGRNGGISASCWRSLESSSVWHGQNTLDHSALAANLGMRIAFHLLQFIDSANRDGLAEALVSVLEQLSLPSDVNCYGLDSGSDLECLAYVFFKRIILFAGSPWFADALLKQPPITAPCDSTNESEETSTVKHWALMWKCADDAVVRLIKETNLVVHQPTAAIFARLARESVKSADAAEWVPHACSISVLLGIAAVGSACGGTWTAPESISAFAEAEVTDEKSRHCFYLLGISLFDQTISMLDKIKDPQTVRQILCQLGGVLDKVLESDPAASTPLPQDELASFLVAAEHSPILDSKTTASGLVKALCGILESDALVKKAPKVIQEPADVDMAPTQDPPAVLPEISGVSGQPSQPSQPKKRSRVSPQASSDCTSEQSTPTKKRKSKRSKKRTPPPTLSSVLGQLEALLMDTGSQSLEELCQVQGRLTGIQQSLCEVMGSKLKSQNAGQGTE